MSNPGKKKVFQSWLHVIFYSLIIFSTVPIAWQLQKFVSDHLGKSVFTFFVLSILFLAFVSLVYYLIVKLKIRSPSNYIWTFIIGGCYAYFILQLKKAPIEAVHFLEYGLLGFFLFRALSLHAKDKTIFLIASLFSLLIGTFDEILQWIMPKRNWDFRDVGLNALSGGLFQLAVWNVIKPKIISEKINSKSLRLLSLMVAVCLLVLGLCVSNTPQRVAWYTKKIPWLSFLQKEEPMSEFGYKYKDSEIGSFKSRINPDILHKEDKNKGEEYAQILNQSVKKNYNEFIREYNPISNPYLHELRIHIFRRDQHFKKGRATSNLNEKKESYFVAYKENLILEKYFTQSIKDSVYAWDENKITEVENLIDPSEFYESPVSANLFTSFSEKTMWVAIFAIISILIAINIFLSLKEKQKNQ